MQQTKWSKGRNPNRKQRNIKKNPQMQAVNPPSTARNNAQHKRQKRINMHAHPKIYIPGHPQRTKPRINNSHKQHTKSTKTKTTEEIYTKAKPPTTQTTNDEHLSQQTTQRSPNERRKQRRRTRKTALRTAPSAMRNSPNIPRHADKTV